MTSIASDSGSCTAIIDRILMGRAGAPADVEDIMVFLASDDAAFATGAFFPIDGRMTIEGESADDVSGAAASVHIVSGADSAGYRVLPVEDPEELASVDALRARVALIPGAITRWERVAKLTPKPGSQIAVDDTVTAWRQLSHAVTHQLNHAADTLNALTVLLPPDGEFRMPYVAHFPVARSALEAASLALWIVGPSDPRVRVERHLRNAWREVSADGEMMGAITRAVAEDPSLELRHMLDRGRKQLKAWRRKHVDQIREVARRSGVPDPTVSSRTVGFAEIVRESTTAVGLPGVFGETVWREISGLSHPSMMRSVRAMDVEEIVDYGDGTFGAMLTSSAGKSRYSVEAAHLAFITAVERFGERKFMPDDSHARKLSAR